MVTLYRLDLSKGTTGKPPGGGPRSGAALAVRRVLTASASTGVSASASASAAASAAASASASASASALCHACGSWFSRDVRK